MSNVEAKNIFRAYDIRGIYGKDITPATFMNIGAAVCCYYREKYGKNHPLVYVGYDIRKTSNTLVHALISGITSQGGEVVFAGEEMAFGQVLFSGWRENADFTAFVTASHLTPEWNGVKFYYGDGVGFSESDIIAIRDLVTKEIIKSNLDANSWKKTGSVRIRNHNEGYVGYFKERMSLKNPIRVAIDCGNAAGGLIAPALFSKLGYDVIELYCDIDPFFPNRDPEPNAQSLKELSELVKSSRASFGIGFDGDGDRAVIVDDKGEVLPSDTTGIVIGQYLLKKRGNGVVLVNVECSIAVEATLDHLADEIKRIKVGHTFLTHEAKETPGVVIGVESSGHMVFPEIFLFDDAMVIPMIIGKMIDENNVLISDLKSIVPFFPKKRATFNFADEMKFKIMDNMIIELKKQYKVDTIDGAGIKFDDGWILIRASNTSPIIRLVVEARSEKECDLLFKQFSDFICQYQKLNM
ncbi:MAG: hypothetical protein ACTSRU_01265 [Candidatus Hodarchaeales archaeon]